MNSTVLDTACEMVAAGNRDRALAVLTTAADAGDANALAELATWNLRGDIIPRDLPRARAYLRRAVAAGHATSALTEAALTANGSGGPADWPGALAMLRQNTTGNEMAAAQIATLDRMRLDSNGAPVGLPSPRRISTRPAVWHARRLFTPEECQHVAHAAADLLQPATVVDPASGRNVLNPIRTSDGAVIGPTRENLVVRALNCRLAALTGTGIDQGEALAVLRYRPGQQFRSHVDALDGTNNQRIRTVLIYLNDGFEGGATFFPHSGLRIVPRAGDAVVFDNVGPDGSIDQQAIHAGEPVKRGTKWLATRWIRARPFSPWTGPEIAL